ncbi:MAG: sigma-70 family RNA polymerase sigma factor [Gemmataceae bacterium]|nr:sigma-70 family RNA polymerase sigma factor [Gemmataceae bacterium]
MPLTQVDNQLLQRCLRHESGAWNDFVDRFIGLIYHVIHFTAYHRSATLQPEDVEDLASDVLLAIVAKDYAVLRQFRGQSSLATYLTVIARRVCVQQLSKRASVKEVQLDGKVDREDRPRVERGIEQIEEVQRLKKQLPARDRKVVQLFYIEGRSYEEIATRLNLPVNSIGPILSRARKVIRAARAAKAGTKKPE